MNRSKDQVEICILAGGLSRRMGRTKALLKLGGISLLRRVFTLARASGFPVRVIRRDTVPRCGPLGGIYTAVSRSSQRAVLFLSCDMPFVTSELLADMLVQFRRLDKACFAARNETPGFPLILSCAALPRIEKLIRERRYSLWELAAELGAALVERPAAGRELININTPEELEMARAWSEPPGDPD